jgi:S-adenosylmethionine decarboxylase
VAPEVLDDLGRLVEVSTAACLAAGATVLDRLEPQGVTVLVLLAESHFAIHTWPEHGMAAVDCFTCGETDVEAAFAVMRAALSPREVVRMNATRGLKIGVPDGS